MTAAGARRAVVTRDPATPLWWGSILLRVITFAFALATVIVHRAEYERPWLAWTVLGAMAVWTLLTSIAYARQGRRWRWLVIVDLFVTTALMLTSPWVLTDAMYAAAAPLITTVWVSGAVVAVAIRFGIVGGVFGGAVIALGTMGARRQFDIDVVRDAVLLIAAGLVIGMAVDALRKAARVRAAALRVEAATAERERLARSIHDSVLQVLAQVRRRGAEFGGEAAELARLAGEQEIALRALVASAPNGDSQAKEADLRARLQVLTTSKVSVSTPAGEVRLPTRIVGELVAVVQEALSNVERHAGTGARAWVLLEDLGHEVIISVRDNGCGIADGRLEQAEAEGRLGVVQSIKGRIAEVGGTIVLDTTPGGGTEWEMRVPRAEQAKEDRSRTGGRS